MIAILQPLIPDYREDFFLGLKDKLDLEIYVLNKSDEGAKKGYKISGLSSIYLRNIKIGKFTIYDPLPLIIKPYEAIVVMGSVRDVSMWVILVFSKLLNKKVVLWGHGISIYRYIEEMYKPSVIKKIMYRLSSGAWFYTKQEADYWQNLVPGLNSDYLNNTISYSDKLLSFELSDDKKRKELRCVYGLKTGINMIFCARFNKLERRADLLVNIMDKLDSDTYGLIIIGDGCYKPDFSGYSNVYDFGAVYDRKLKTDFFMMADLYLQPAWIGLSGVEAMLYGLPVFTLMRSPEIKQCVEYNYLINGLNSVLRSDVDLLSDAIKNMSMYGLEELRASTKKYATENLSIRNMVNNALRVIDECVR